jgi:hypothetical protein
VYHDDERRLTEDRDGLDVVHRVVGELVDRGIRRVAAGDVDQRVAVGLRAHGGLHADRAARARSVVDDDGLAQRIRHFLRDDARHDVGAAARRERHDHPDRLGRILASLRRDVGGREREAGEQSETE